MFEQSAPNSPSPGQPYAVPLSGLAVLLNANARRVNERVIAAISGLVPPEQVFVSRSANDIQSITETILKKRYATVFCGGGDGTFMGLVNGLFSTLRKQSQPQPLPRLGLLKLGTGNSLASMLGASSSKQNAFLEDLARALANDVPGAHRLELLEIEGQKSMFAGLGCDGQVLNDYVWVKDNWAKGLLSRALTGLGGYFTAIATQTLPHYLRHSSWTDCEATNGGAISYRLAADGSPTGDPILPGEILFRGRINVAAAATIPFYGFNFRMFPFAGKRPAMMHLRLAGVSPWSILANLPRIWRGEYFGEGVHDFHVAEVLLRFSHPMPLQIGGDAAGVRESVALRMAPETVELLDFSGKSH